MNGGLASPRGSVRESETDLCIEGVDSADFSCSGPNLKPADYMPERHLAGKGHEEARSSFSCGRFDVFTTRNARLIRLMTRNTRVLCMTEKQQSKGTFADSKSEQDSDASATC